MIAFDEHLRGAGQPGLKGRTRTELWKEVASQHSDEFQKFMLQRYADAMAVTQKKMADAGVDFTCETHGSFPLAGGKLGAEIAQSDVGVGTDLFWELRDEDVLKGIGLPLGACLGQSRFAFRRIRPVGMDQRHAAEPDVGVAERRRRALAPAMVQHVLEGTHHLRRPVSALQPSTDFPCRAPTGEVNDGRLDRFNRVQSTMIWVRPEKPAGVGIVTSWPLQEHRMAPNSTAFGFGLYASNGYHPEDGHNHDGAQPQVDAQFGEVYYRLVKNGVPVSFVASTDTLKKWHGIQPLVAVDGFETDPAEIALFDGSTARARPSSPSGSAGSAGRTEAEALFGVTKADEGWTPRAGTQVVKDADGQPLAYVTQRSGRAPTLFCPLPVTSIDGAQSALLADWVQKLSGEPVTVPYGVTAAPFVSEGSLFVAFSNSGDTSRTLDLVVRPGAINAAFAGQRFALVDHDRAVIVPSEWKDGALHFRIPCGPNDGRLIQLVPLKSAT